MLNTNDLSKICHTMDKTTISSTQLDDLCYSNMDDESKNTPKEIIPFKFLKLVEQNPNFPVLKYKSAPNSDFDLTITMKEYLDQTKKAANRFINLGLNAKASVGIIGSNHPNWFISELGTIFAGGIACGIYKTNNADTCKFIMNDCNCQIMVVEDKEQLEKVLSVLPEVPQLKAIIVYTDLVIDEYKNKYSIPIYTWSELMNTPHSSKPISKWEERVEKINSDDCALLIYTSGTTGLPKGVMLSHDNVIFTIQMISKHLDLQHFSNSIISYLPLSHVAANMLDVMTTITIGVTIYFAEPDALKGSLGKTLREVRPTLFVAVPRVLEKMQEQLQEITNKKCNEINDKNSKESPSSSKKDNEKIKKALGLDRCEYIASAAAPITLQTLEYFQSLDIPIYQLYGMSECSGPHTLGTKQKNKIGTVGTVMKGVELKIFMPNENMIGEICMRGRHVFLGYFNDERKTRETLDAEGWLHSGDLGRMEDNEFLTITGRIKELIITAGGENIAPVPIEDKIKEELPFVSNCMLIGDHKKFISCLLTLKTEIDPNTMLPTDDLTPAAIRSLNSIGINVTKVGQVRNNADPVLEKAIKDAMKRVNLTAVSRAAYVQKWIFLPTDFSIPGGELSPTLKMKRSVISQMYSSLIDSIYQQQ